MEAFYKYFLREIGREMPSINYVIPIFKIFPVPSLAVSNLWVAPDLARYFILFILSLSLASRYPRRIEILRKLRILRNYGTYLSALFEGI